MTAAGATGPAPESPAQKARKVAFHGAVPGMTPHERTIKEPAGRQGEEQGLRELVVSASLAASERGGGLT